MELKEMADTGVIITGEDEYNEYNRIRESGGWPPWTLDHVLQAVKTKVCCFSAFRERCWDNLNTSSIKTKITLAQFKERNGIMKYQEGQILKSGNVERKILGVHSNLYHMSADEEFTTAGRDFTEQQLDSGSYTLKTDEPEMVELTLEDVAKLKGIPVETLRIKD